MSTSAHTHRGPHRLFGALVLALALAGCGSSASTQSQSSSHPGATQAAATSAQAGSSTSANGSKTASSSSSSASSSTPTAGEPVPQIDMVLKSSVALQPIASRYTCDGADTPLPLSWTKVPAHTAQIDLFVAAVNGAGAKLFLDWGVAGLKPTLRKLSGHLPAGAIVGRNSFGTTGYSVCPPKGSEENYVVIVDALKKREPVKPGFNATSLLEHLLHTEVSEGRIAFFYKRA
ncbi:MAG TPA: hypothetical protein VHT29_04795 [Solirubrobacteraceae bacterium]|nr:hypothetical protein [Solirubrobacteraceae bacterium]